MRGAKVPVVLRTYAIYTVGNLLCHFLVDFIDAEGTHFLSHETHAHHCINSQKYHWPLRGLSKSGTR